MKIFYTTEHCGESFFELEVDHWDIHDDGEFIAEAAAEDYHSNHDGWESIWPLDFSLHEKEGGPEIAKYSVEREAEPIFSAVQL